jgi:abortive infection bacteriophage resistance protein
MPKVPYTKKALSYTEQLSTLKERGLIIENEEKSIHLLEQISYYRLSAYWYPLLEEPKSEHRFKPNTTFEIGFNLYCFDRELRKFIQAELEKVEISVRAKMIYEFWHNHDAFWFLNKIHYHSEGKFNQLIEKLKDAVKKSDEDFIKSFKDKYSDPMPPACMILEVSSFGNLSSLFGNLKRGSKEARNIANYYGLDEKTFSSWLHSLTYVRNLCAHHSRLWNRIMDISPAIPISPKRMFIKNTILPNHIKPEQPFINNNRVYYLLSILIYLMNTINPKHRIKNKFLDFRNYKKTFKHKKELHF